MRKYYSLQSLFTFLSIKYYFFISFPFPILYYDPHILMPFNQTDPKKKKHSINTYGQMSSPKSVWKGRYLWIILLIY